jgi:hypothetical protein
MTAASPAASQARRPVSRPSAPAQSAPMRAAPALAFDSDDGDEIRINLADIPRMSFALDSSMHVEGLKPTLLSRLVNLLMPKP